MTEFLSSSDNTDNFLFDSFEFRTVFPNFNPIDAMMMSTDISDSCIKKELCDVGGWWTICASSSEIFNYIFAIFSKRTKVITMSFGCKGKYTIELFD
jgi:hypothetical protein